MRLGRTAAKPKMRLVPVVIEENERWRMRADGRMVPLAGIEPALLAELDFESSASTSSATGAFASPDPQKRTGALRSGRTIAAIRRGSTRADVISCRLDSGFCGGYDRAARLYCLCMISEQTRSAFVARENRCPPRITCGAELFPNHAPAGR